MDKSISFPQPDHMLCFSVYAAGLAFNRLYRDLLKQFDITYPQFLVLLALRQKNDCKVNDLGDALFLESNTLTPILKKLEAMGLIRRQRSTEDERQVNVSLTDAGRALRQRGLQRTLVKATGLQADEFARLQKTVATVRDNLIRQTQDSNGD